MENNEWTLLFDGSKCIHGVGAGIVLINPNGDVIPMSYRLSFDCTNNMEEYEALILGLKAKILMKVKRIKIFSTHYEASVQHIQDQISQVATIQENGRKSLNLV